MKKIIILGAGFGGLAAAKTLLKQKENLQITLIDKNPAHIVHGNLYEVATSPEDLTSMVELKRSVAIPLNEIFPPNDLKLVTETITEVDLNRNIVKCGEKSFEYDYLISALGSGPNFFAIPGAKDFGLTMMSAIDALKIRSQVELAIQMHKLDPKKPVINVMVVGGGVGGVEVAAELQKMIDFLAWENDYTRSKISTTIIERSPSVLKGFPDKVVQLATARLHALGVKLQLNTTIQKVNSHNVISDQGQYNYDVLVWTGGVSANSLPGNIQTPLAIGKRIEVNDFFQISNHPNVYVIGDQCCHFGPTSEPLPGTASQAIDHAEYVARRILLLSKNKKSYKHECRLYPFVIPMGGKWAIFSSQKLLISGYFGYVIRQLVWLRYFVSILGYLRGFHWWLRSNELYSRND